MGNTANFCIAKIKCLIKTCTQSKESKKEHSKLTEDMLKKLRLVIFTPRYLVFWTFYEKKVFVLISENMNIIFKEQIQEYQPIRQIYKIINVLQKCSDGISLFQSSAFTKEEKHGK